MMFPQRDSFGYVRIISILWRYFYDMINNAKVVRLGRRYHRLLFQGALIMIWSTRFAEVLDKECIDAIEKSS